MPPAVVVLGGYGNFGRRIVEALAVERNCRVLIAGRDLSRARELAEGINDATAVQLDCTAPGFADELHALGAAVVVHTAGPFQARSYDVPLACVKAGAHYVDLADGREYVCGITSLDRVARDRGVLVASGASSLPALSAAVIDALAPQFSRIEAVEHGISSGAKPPGLATMDGVLSYVGRPFKQKCAGEWRIVHGWQDLASYRYPAPIGRRWLANCDVPDLELFPARYADTNTVVFRAGVGFASSTFAVWACSWLVRAGLMKSLSSHAPRLHRLARLLEPHGSKWSAMHVKVSGRGCDGDPLVRTWTLLAGEDHGPNIPCFPAIALARKLLRGECAARGAMPCMGLLTVDEILAVGRGLQLRVQVTEGDAHPE